MLQTILDTLSQHYLLALVVVILVIKNFVFSSNKADVAEPVNSKVVKITSDNEYNDIIETAAVSHKLVVIDFYANWCGPCRSAAPIYSKLSSEFVDVVFLKVNVDNSKNIMMKHKVNAMPTFVVILDGEQVDQLVGFDENKLRALIQKHNNSSCRDKKRD